MPPLVTITCVWGMGVEVASFLILKASDLDKISFVHQKLSCAHNYRLLNVYFARVHMAKDARACECRKFHNMH